MTNQPQDKGFEPIESQAEFDARLKARLAREREKWEKENGVDIVRNEYQAKLDQMEAEVSEMRLQQHRESVEHTVRQKLSARGVTDEGRIGRVLRLVDFDAIGSGELRPEAAIDSELARLAKDLPELLSPRDFTVGAGSGGSSKPVLEPEKPLTREEVERLSPEGVNSNWERVQRFLRGER